MDDKDDISEFLTRAAKRAAEKVEKDRRARERKGLTKNAVRVNKEPGIPMAKVRRPPAAPIRQRLDVYVSHASQLVAADQAHESVERIVGTISLALTMLLDMLRAGAGADACPHISLGTHLAGVRELPGVPTATLFYQGLCFYAGSDTFEGVANGVEPYDFVAAGCSPERNMADAELKMYPVATITDAQKSKPAVIEIDLRGKLTVTFARHGETHVATSLPRIVLTRPAGAPSWGLFELSLSGSLELECQARGLRASLTLRPGGVVAGTIERLAGATFQRQCRVSGTLALGVVALREGRGDAHPVLARQAPWPQVDLARIGPRLLPQVWACLHDCILSAGLDGFQSAGGAVKGSHKDLAHSIVQFLDPLYAGTSSPLGPKAGNDDDVDSDDEDRDRPTQLPPEVWAQKRAGRKLRMLLKYIVCDGKASPVV